MKKSLFVALSVVLCVTMVASFALAKGSQNSRFDAQRISINDRLPLNPADELSAPYQQGMRFAGAAQGTTFLARYSFDTAGNCDAMGWTTHDLTLQDAGFFHADDFVGVVSTGGFTVAQPLEGNWSLWGGWRSSSVNPNYCGYATLPGYGNGEDHGYCTDACLNVTGDVIVDYLVQWDSEISYDGTGFDADIDCNDTWTPYTTPLMGFTVAFGTVYTFYGASTVDQVTVPSADHSGTMRLRFRFRSDGGWGDQDGLWDTDGPIIIDSLTVRDDNGIVLATEDYENQPADGDGVNWSECDTGTYGSFHDLSKASNILQEDPCGDNFSCVWSYYKNSSEDYSCGGFGAQLAVPKIQGDLVIINSIRSPEFPNIGSGVQYEYTWTAYLDNPLDNLVFQIWAVRYRTPDGLCLGTFEDRNFVYYDGTAFDGLKQWVGSLFAVGDLIDPQAQTVQLQLGVQDMCIVWCGTVGSGNCHSHGPLQDNVVFYRIDTSGPQWNVNDGNQFHDNFASTGSGFSRMDQGYDRLPPTNPSIYTGDSATVVVNDPADSLATDAYTGQGAAVYLYASVWPQGGRSGIDMEETATPNASGYTRWPVVDSLMHNGQWWYCIRADTSFTGRANARTGAQPDRFCVDLNDDDFFVPGDTLCFFWSAISKTNAVSYWSPLTGQTTSQSLVLQFPGEATILPAGGVARGGDILYVDGGGGTNEQVIVESAFQFLGIEDKVDRFDVRQPSSGLGNRPSHFVKNVLTQLIGNYRKIVWVSGASGTVMGDGTIDAPDKSPDIPMLSTFLDQHTASGGIYLSGDDLAEQVSDLPGGPAFTSVWIDHVISSPNAARSGYGINPLCIGDAGSIFEHGGVPDSLVAYGGCPFIARFDVFEPRGTALTQMTYGAADNAGLTGESTNSMVISQVTNNAQGNDMGVVLEGASFHILANDRPQSPPDYVDHMRDVLTFLNNIYDDPVSVGGTSAYRYSLDQNYPNPFNPQTTIAFTVKEQAHVSLKIYNVAGQLVRTLVNETRDPGVNYRVTWDGRNDAGSSVSSGVYFYKLVSRNFTQTKKMVLLK